ncbi:MAG: AarF/ABC1/UbiB kinase family protein [Desulfobacterales bacterium]|nr:AarF/ABC1/UbiB kinase family protein [Desulfobacterales bacterium]
MVSIRKIGVLGRTYRHLNRYRKILSILFKYGFGDLLELLKIDQYIEVGLQMISQKKREPVDKLSKAQRLRLAFEELGPTYIKLGQILSIRPDLIPAAFIEELAKLQDNVPPFSFSDVKQIIENELGRPVEEVYSELSNEPLASASIGQVHKAVLMDNEQVAIKIQRPGIRKTIEIDLEIMLHLATLAERHIEELAVHQPVRIVEEFARTLEKEIDYTIEAANMQRFAHNFLNDATIYVPKVFQGLSTSRILTMEFVDGIKVSKTEQLDQEGLDRELITARGTDIILKQVFYHGFFHADPHPGNIYVLPHNVICLFDFGMVGSTERHTRERFVDLIDAVVRRDAAMATQVLLRLTLWEERPEMRLLEGEMADFMGKHLYKPLKDIEVGKLLQQLIELASRHKLRIPADLFLMMKALATVEGVGRLLYPEFDMIAQAAPFIEKVKMNRFSPKRIADDIAVLASDSIAFVQQFPKDLLEITRLIRQKKLSVKFEHQGLYDLLATHDQISNRLSFAIIIAALIIGSAIIILSKIPPYIFGISLIGIIGFLAAAIMGIWLLIAILKKGRL